MGEQPSDAMSKLYDKKGLPSPEPTADRDAGPSDIAYVFICVHGALRGAKMHIKSKAIKKSRLRLDLV